MTAGDESLVRRAALSVLDHGVPGAVVAVATPATTVVEAVGHRQVFGSDGPLDTPLPMTAETGHDLGSVTKVLGTTAALMRLVDLGELSLDSPVCSFVPSFTGDGKSDVTVEALLRHRGGLWEWWPTYLTCSTANEAVDTAAQLPLRYSPGAGFHYSDLGFMLLGRVVETVTGSPLAEAVRGLVLDRLGLASARYGTPACGDDVAAGSRGDAIERRMVETGDPYPVRVSAEGFAWRTHVLVGDVNDGNAFHAFGGAAGHAGLFARADDLLTFGRALVESLDGGGAFGAATVRRFFTAGPDPAQALGFRVWRRGGDGDRGAALGHPGFPGTAFAVLPERRATVVMLTNRLHVTGEPARTEALWEPVLAQAREHVEAERRVRCG